MQDLQRQLEALEHLKSYLVSFIDHLGELSGSYNSNMDKLIETGLTIQIAESYKMSYQLRNINALKALAHSIETEDIPYVNRNIEALKELIERAKSK